MSNSEQLTMQRQPMLEARVAKINQSQRNMLTEYMLGHLDFAWGRFTGSLGVASARQMWVDLAENLHKTGPQKTVDQWKKCWKDMKSRSRGKVTAIQLEQKRTGNFPNHTEPLTDEDKQILSVIGSDAVEGIKGVHDSAPATVAELRRLMAGDETPLAGRPVEGVRIFEALDINVQGSMSAEDKETHINNTLNKHTQPLTNMTEQIHTGLSTTQTQYSNSSPSNNTFTTCSPATGIQSTYTAEMNIPATGSSPTCNTETDSPSTNTRTIPTQNSTLATCFSPTQVPHTLPSMNIIPTPPSPPSDVISSNQPGTSQINPHQWAKRKRANPFAKSVSNLATGRRGKKHLDEKAQGFLEVQAKQNQILETMAAAMLLDAENEKKRIELTERNESMRLEIAREELNIKRQKIVEQKKLNDTLSELLKQITK